MSKPDDPFAEISADELAAVNGGAGGFFGFLDSLYKKVVFHFGSEIGGKQLAQKMYGSRMTSHDTARAQAAMKKFLVAGHKLPKGVPNLFG